MDPPLHSDSTENEDILGLISDGETAIRELDNQIIMAAVSLASLVSQKRGRQQHLTSLRSCLSPVWRMPSELLSHIFAF
jgi:hypothetical protein